MTERIEFDGRILDGAPRINMSRRAIITGIAAGTVFPFVSSCTTNPATGTNQLVFFGDDQVASMAASAWTDMKAQTPVTANTGLKNRVLNVWSRTIQGAEKEGHVPQGASWDVAVFDTDDVNAFVMPGNRVGVYRGITELTENDDQLSSVLGHETGHVVGRHAAERLSVSTLAQVSLTASQIAIASNDELSKYGTAIGALGGAAMQFGVILPYSRRHELEADRLGVDYMHQAGYDVTQSVRLWELMDANSSGQRQPEFLSTHPDPANRAAALRQYINAKGYALM
ncbi:M48 family metallopeptidase [Hyphomonas johnsonii]|uniref:M48 family peptidase n=1 Tax=Hyphomonas johnsonii MHS-2 TaxID=1280950 RepID=A0A059FE79_9PROT|nr:M48 family metallopeptidase [Hyphomonas johnsonii]KCZ88924.1 M48 family peptidase [Hyphomonas johnsonii MHS-2]